MRVPGVCEHTEIRPERRALRAGFVVYRNCRLEVMAGALEIADADEGSRQRVVRLARTRWVVASHRQRLLGQRARRLHVRQHEAERPKAPEPANRNAAATERCGQ